MAADAYVVCARVSGVTYKIFRISCGKDGSIYVHFPYVPDGGALVGEVSLDPQIKYPATLTVGPDFSTTIHKVKYTHHTDGRAHFSQDGKIFTRVRRKAVPFDQVRGHLFTVMVEGVSKFVQLTKRPSGSVLAVPFEFDNPTNSVKFLAHIYDKAEWAKIATYGDSSPWVLVMDSDGKRSVGIMVGTTARRNSEQLYMLLSASAREDSYVEHDVQLAFMGGFDPSEMVHDHSKPTSCLMLLHPPGGPVPPSGDAKSIDLPSGASSSLSAENSRSTGKHSRS